MTRGAGWQDGLMSATLFPLAPVPYQVKRHFVARRENAVVNRLNKTKQERQVDYAAQRIERERAKGKLRRQAAEEAKQQEEAERQRKLEEKTARDYSSSTCPIVDFLVSGVKVLGRLLTRCHWPPDKQFFRAKQWRRSGVSGIGELVPKHRSEQSVGSQRVGRMRMTTATTTADTATTVSCRVMLARTSGIKVTSGNLRAWGTGSRGFVSGLKGAPCRATLCMAYVPVKYDDCRDLMSQSSSYRRPAPLTVS